MLGPLSSIVTKIQGKSHHLEKVIGPDPSDAHKTAKVDNVEIREGANTDDVLKKENGNFYDNPYRSECSDVIGDALSSEGLQSANEKGSEKGEKSEKHAPEIPLPDSEKITRMDKIFQKTNTVIRKLKGENGYKSNQKSIKTNPNNKGNLIDRKTG